MKAKNQSLQLYNINMDSIDIPDFDEQIFIENT